MIRNNELVWRMARVLSKVLYDHPWDKTHIEDRKAYYDLCKKLMYMVLYTPK